MSVAAFTDALYTKLTAVQTPGSLYDALSGRIRQGWVDQRMAFPYLTFNVIASTPQRYMGTAIMLELLVQFDIWCEQEKGVKAAQQIEELLWSLLEGQTIAPNAYDRGVITFTSRGVPTIDDETWRITSEAVIRGTDF